jgi:hypothetical protein
MARKKSNGLPTGRGNKLLRVYTDLNASFGSAAALADAAGVSRERAKEFLRGVDSHTLHMQRRIRFKRNRYIIPRMKFLFEADLVDMQNWSRENSGHKYILNVIDTFSKYLWSVPLKDKTGKSVKAALATIFEGGNFPKYFQVDRGLEFKNREVMNYLAKNNVKFLNTRNEIKGAVIERLNRSLKTKMFKYFTHRGTHKYIDILHHLVAAYNNTKHSAIGRAPATVCAENEQEVYDYLYSGRGRYKQIALGEDTHNIKLNDYVRLSRPNLPFVKSYEGTWTHEVFKVVKILKNKERILYEVVDWNGKLIDARFYPEEIQVVRVGEDTEFKIHKIIRSVGTGNSRKLLVRWSGYGPEFDSFIYARDLVKL